MTQYVEYYGGDYTVSRVSADKKRYIGLLLTGDEQESMIDLYLERGDMFVLEDDGVKAVSVVTDEGEGVCELKNIAVSPQSQGRGYGRKMMDFLLHHYSCDFERMIAGTGEVPSTVGFYMHLGFTFSHRIKDFFVDNYDHVIVEDGIQLRDMVYMSYNLSEIRRGGE